MLTVRAAELTTHYRRVARRSRFLQPASSARAAVVYELTAAELVVAEAEAVTAEAVATEGVQTC